MKYIVTPAVLQASIVSSSRTEPPGCTMAVTPASMSTCGPSSNGKNASEAATAPRARSVPSARLLARSTASLQESTRLTWPMPMPTEAPSLASRIALDFAERQARQAKARSASTSGEAASPVASVQADGSSPSAWKESRCCMSRPPETGRVSTPPRSRSSQTRMRMFFLRVSTSTAPSS